MVEKSLSQFTLLTGTVRAIEASRIIVGYRTQKFSYLEDSSDNITSCVLF